MASGPMFPFADEPSAEPLDLTTLAPSPQAKPEDQKSRWIKLALLAPLLAKAGPHAMTGFLQGWNNSTQQRAQQERQAGLDAERQRQMQAQQQYQQQQLAGQAQTRQQALLKQYSDAVSAATTPEEVQAIKQAYLQQAQSVGLRPGPIEALAGAQTQDKLLTRRISATWAKLPAESKQEALKNGWSLNVDGQAVPFEQWSQAVGGVVDPVTGKPPKPVEDVPDLTKSGLDVQAADALRRGDTATYERLLKVKKDIGMADDRPPASADSSVRDQRRFNMEQKLVAQWDKSVTPYREMRRQLDLMETGLKRFRQGDKNGGSQAVLVTFQKVLDPTSVVRESEYARSAAGVSLVARLEGYAERLRAGGAGVPDAELAAMVQTARDFLSGMASYNNGLRARIDRTSKEYELDPRMIFDDPPDEAGAAPAAVPSAPKSGGINLGGGIVVRPK